ncbi:CocE/NonD family hydrolase [Bradyrhizobium sp. Ec3.3]|uniref:CocE/NonD family hydrolase n=1 Tax=Bradyrhizobium sp. Ec3.3 TaxID=189753 RepID=UPI0003F7B023|nr:CocE/NonD family hydrolase [Bradyrhizobium sp. Ec3.3]
MTAPEKMFPSGNQPPSDYDRPADFKALVCDKDVQVAMRDGVNLAVDIYRPDAPGPFPVLLAFGVHSKEFQGDEYPKTFPPQPSWSSLWMGHMEAGDTEYFVTRGYIHVVAQPRGWLKSGDGGSREWDSFDLIEWIAKQPWCADGNVGMIGIGAFASEQYHAARQQPPHLKAIFPYDPRGAYGVLGGFREEYPGGLIHSFRYVGDHVSTMHTARGAPGPLSPEREENWRLALQNPDYKMYPFIHNVLVQKGQTFPRFFDTLIDPYDSEDVVKKAEDDFEKINVPTHTGAAWYGYTYKTHLCGAQTYFQKIKAPKRLTLNGPAHLDRPLRALRGDMLRWYDHWLRDVDTGVMEEPPVRYFVSGANEWRSGQDWPLPETQWTKLYLNSWERLTAEPFKSSSVDDYIPPDLFVQMPPTQTNRIEKLRFLSDPLPHDVLIAGPSVLNLFASIDQDDTNWIISLRDVGPDPHVRTAREGEREIRADLPSRELTRGWLKASHRALDPSRSKPWKPWHRLTREAQRPVVPGEISEYNIELLSTANLFRRGHRICIEIACLDLGSGVLGATNVEYIPYHLCRSTPVLHRIYHDPKHPSHVLLPVIPT